MPDAMNVNRGAVERVENAVDVPALAEQHLPQLDSQIDGFIGERPNFGMMFEIAQTCVEAIPPKRCGSATDVTPQ